MPGTRRPRIGPAVAVLAVALALGPIVSPGPAGAQIVPRGDWLIDTNSLYVDRPFSPYGDYPLVGIIGFRTRLGMAGLQQTSVWVQRPLTELCGGARAGTTCAVPDAEGAVNFGRMFRPSLADLVAGGEWSWDAPEIVGTITYVTYFGAGQTFDDTFLRGLQSTISLGAASNLLSPLSAADVADGALDVFEQIERHGQGHLAVPGFTTGMVAVADDLRQEVDLKLLSGSRDRSLSRTAAAVLGPRSLLVPHLLPGGVRYFAAEEVVFRPTI